MKKYTQGPWKNESCGSLNMNGEVVCDVDCLGPDHAPMEEKRANARLIAAAPELLEAVRSLYAEMLEHAATRSPAVEALIAKAEGEV